MSVTLRTKASQAGCPTACNAPTAAFVSVPAKRRLWTSITSGHRLQRTINSTTQSPHIEQQVEHLQRPLELSEDWLHRLQAQGVALTPPLGLQLAAHPVPGREFLGDVSSRCGRRFVAAAGLFRCDERVRAQGLKFDYSSGRVVTGFGGGLPGPCAGVGCNLLDHNYRLPLARCDIGGASCRNHLMLRVHHRLTVVPLSGSPCRQRRA